MTLPVLTDYDRQAYEKIFHPTAAEPVEWREVRSLFRAIAQTEWLPNGDWKVMRNGRVLILRPPATKDVSGPDEILELRRFIERSSESPPVLEPPLLEPPPRSARMAANV